MGGLNETDRLRKAGIPAKKASVSRVPLSCCVVKTAGPTAHPRARVPLDVELKDWIKLHGVPVGERRFKAKEDGDRLEVIDGARRTKAGLVAQAELQREAPRQPPLEWDRSDPNDPGQLFVDCEIVICGDLELMLERLDANVSRGLPDSKSVLAAIVKQIVRINKGEPDAALMARIVAAMPHGVTSSVVLALARWDNLAPELQERLDDPAVPIGLLVPVVEARAEDRDALLTSLLAKKITTARGAKRAENTERERDGEPRPRRLPPRKLLAVAKAVVAVPVMAPAEDEFRRGLAAGLKLAAGKRAGKLPKPIAEAIKGALAPSRKP